MAFEFAKTAFWILCGILCASLSIQVLLGFLKALCSGRKRRGDRDGPV